MTRRGLSTFQCHRGGPTSLRDVAHERVPHGRRRLKQRRTLTLAGLLGQIDRAPRKRACALQLARSGERERLEVGQLGLGRVTLGPRELPFHGCVVASEEREVKTPGG